MDSKRFKSVICAPAVGPACIIMGLTMLAFGVPFLCPSFRSFNQGPAYAQLFQVAPHTVWVCVFAFTGGIRVVAAIFGSYRHRTLSTGLAIFLWCFLFLNFAMTAPLDPLTAIFGLWTVLEGWTLFRIEKTSRVAVAPVVLRNAQSLS